MGEGERAGGRRTAQALGHGPVARWGLPRCSQGLRYSRRAFATRAGPSHTRRPRRGVRAPLALRAFAPRSSRRASASRCSGRTCATLFSRGTSPLARPGPCSHRRPRNLQPSAARRDGGGRCGWVRGSGLGRHVLPAVTSKLESQRFVAGQTFLVRVSSRKRCGGARRTAFHP